MHAWARVGTRVSICLELAEINLVVDREDMHGWAASKKESACRAFKVSAACYSKLKENAHKPAQQEVKLIGSPADQARLPWSHTW